MTRGACYKPDLLSKMGLAHCHPVTFILFHRHSASVNGSCEDQQRREMTVQTEHQQQNYTYVVQVVCDTQLCINQLGTVCKEPNLQKLRSEKKTVPATENEDR